MQNTNGIWHDRDGANSKSQGGQEPKNTQKLTPKTEKLNFITFLHYNFEKSGGSADPSDPPVTPSLHSLQVLLILNRKVD